MERKEWQISTKALMQEITDTMNTIAEIRDEVESWGVTRKQADLLCLTFFKAALERGRQ